MSKVKGEDWVFYAFSGGIWKPYVCARSGNININTSTIETTVTGSGNFKTFEATVHDFSASIDGIISLSVAGSLTIADLQALQLAKTKILCRFVQTDLSGNVYRKEAYFIITGSTDTGSFDGIATFSINLLGTGAITQIFTPPPTTTPGDMRYPEQGDTAPYTPGAYTWSLPGLAPTNTNLTNVVKDGRGSNNIILSGTPVGNEVLFEEDPVTPSDGLLTWAVPFEEVETPPYITYNQI